MCLEKFCPPTGMNTVSPSLQLLCVCFVGEGKEREIQQEPGLFQAASNNRLAPQRGTKRASEQADCAGGVFHILWQRVREEDWTGGVQEEELVCECLSSWSRLACCNRLPICFVLLGFLFHFGFPSDFYQELIQHFASRWWWWWIFLEPFDLVDFAKPNSLLPT